MATTEKNEFWISPKIGIVVLKDGKVVISDGVTLAYGLQRLPAKVTRNSDREFRLGWQIEGGLHDGKYLLPDAAYTAKISKASNKITVRGKLTGYRRSFVGRGVCKVRTG